MKQEKIEDIIHYSALRNKVLECNYAKKADELEVITMEEKK